MKLLLQANYLMKSPRAFVSLKRRSFPALLLITGHSVLQSAVTASAFSSLHHQHKTARPFHGVSGKTDNNVCFASTSSTVDTTKEEELLRSEPPVARRDESAKVWAGVPPADWPKDVMRQSENSKEKLVDPPIAIPDPYGWLRDEKRENKEMLEHLKQENAYTQYITKDVRDAGLVENLYKEMLSAIQETDYTTPRPDGDYWYYSRTYEGKSYTTHCRAPKARQDASFPKITWNQQADKPILDGEQTILDVNELAEGKPYCGMGSVVRSPSHKLLAYTADFKGDEICQMFVKDLSTNKIVHSTDEKLQLYGTIRWGADDNTLFYLKLDKTQRPYQVYRRKLNSDGADELLFEELDGLNWMGIYKSLDGKYLFIESSSKETTEIHFLDLTDDSAKLQCVAPRRSKVLYEVEHKDGMWWISSNVGSKPNMALYTAPAVANSQGKWELVRDKSSSNAPCFDGGYDRSLDGVTCLKNHVVAYGREDGLPRVWILGGIKDSSATGGLDVSRMERLTFPEKAHDAGLGDNKEYDTDKIAVAYSSMVTPPSTLEIDLDDQQKRKVLKERAVPGYDKEKYACDRITVTSRDGKTEIPVSMVYRKDVMEQHIKDKKPVPLHLYGYGSYGICMEADFVSTRLPLLNRGMIYVTAHVRGGGEMGRQWYEEPNGAKYLCKKNTFNDFCDVASWLVNDKKLTSPDRMSCEGRSAGGLLIGASINQAPELYKVAILGVPFVDVVPTMIDARIPLTTEEWEEWGNPNEEKYHKYMMEYSPVQNVKKAKYPACLLIGGLYDPRVQYWEPAKFAAELRHSQGNGSGPVCLKIDMSAGHFSASDRYKYLKEKAFDFAFMLDQLGIANQEKST